MVSKLDFGLAPLDFHRMAGEAVREVRAIIANEPITLRGLFWSVMWEAARVSNKQIITSLLGAQSLFTPSNEDLLLVARLALATYYRPELLVQLPESHQTADVRPFRPKAKPENPDQS